MEVQGCISLQEFSLLVKVSMSSVYRLMKKSSIEPKGSEIFPKTIRLGRRVLIPVVSYNEWISKTNTSHTCEENKNG